MLGENHSLRNEFPDHIDTITSLISSNVDFAEIMKKYDALDKQIRDLEMRDSPIADESIHELKQQRVVMKDALYHQITLAEQG
ncbi:MULTISPECIES: YdcH family protein [unclassified Shewanella]|uniref:YdcH family protein n=1 Tax=unclassified Shewanella TaxID=196818 RepID=UPI000C82E7C2|nr:MULTISPECIES: YdcH family protein [unclassified Shewanella]MDO6618336.1 YdcH family protein [Shewanella sp. 6_MG-2023]MDO6640719.1 YdcH family protein [Shewanella sp. 5_MG-2023]MDO6679259.1 YdcH family protein [Shewanella sp. 4_MG-2023]MDO6776405.1 YdcH family protein [Shewanella sp. 3_MG-2023]PMG28399.1 hypothetical protein BCU94_17040 [Shewanella sp. 10N.286.52.C2]